MEVWIGRRAGQRSPLATRTGVIPGIGHLAGGPQELRSTRTRPAHAKVGDLDPTFGTGGKVTTDISGMANADQANALVVQADGKLVAGGLASTGASDFALARYRAR